MTGGAGESTASGHCASLCEVIGRPDLRDDPRLATRPSRFEHRTEIWAALEEAFRGKSAAEWVAALMAADVPVAEVNTLDRTLNDPQVRHRGMVVELEDGHGAKLRVAGNPLKFSDTAPEPHGFPPPLGAHTRDICKAVLGMTDGDVEALVAAGVLVA